ncbi:MAG TPA: glutathione S-transferase N-terminal domain-containing protein [Myxococcota bacterium]
MVERLLVSLPVSPYSERARWALDHHCLVYTTIVHAPFIGEKKLRALTRVADGVTATAPALIEGDVVIADSTGIARYADAHADAAGAKLFPADDDGAVDRWVLFANNTSAASRLLVTAALLDSGAALDETLPSSLGILRAPLRPVTRYGTRWFARKYGVVVNDDTVADATDVIRQALRNLRAALNGRQFLLADFSWADIVTCLMLQGVRPVVHERYRLRPATRRAWTNEALASEFADLLAWRDALYATRR